MNLKKRWLSLPWNGNTDAKLIEERFERLRSAYSAPDRGYHDLMHIQECLQEFDSIKHFVECPLSFEFALWYHDYVYLTQLPIKSGQSELRSSYVLMEDLIRLGVEARIVSLSARLVFATQHTHTPLNNDEKYIMDIDIAIFGQSVDRVNRYEAGIRKEFPIINKDPEARKVRIKILQSFLKRDHVYHTPDFRLKYEERARMNLERLIKGLE